VQRPMLSRLCCDKMPNHPRCRRSGWHFASFEVRRFEGVGRAGQAGVSVKIVHSGHQQVLEDTAGVVAVMETIMASL
jgi:hypothetical protein